MQKAFDSLIESYIENKVGISKNFLSTTLAQHLRDNLLALYNNQQLLSAGTGNSAQLKFDSAVRSDKIFWLDKAHGNLPETTFFELMDAFVLYLNQTCYTGITSYEFHYAMYEQGSFYKKHFDQFKSDSSRAFSVIIYLNEHWRTADGGELCIYHAERKEVISPENGKCIFFKSSDLEHEVLVTHKERMSITGWLKV